MSARSSIFEVFEPPLPEGALLAGRKTQTELAFDRGRAEGLAEGLLAGRQDGKAEGRAAGLAEGREKGLAEGRAKALDETESLQGQALEDLAALLKAGVAARAEAEARLSADAAAAARAIVAALLPRLSRDGLAKEVAAMTEELMRDAALGAASLRVAPEQEAAALTALEARRARGGGGEIALETDPSLTAAEARLEWRDGLAVFDAEDAAQRILAHLDERLRPEPAAPAPGLAPQSEPEPPSRARADHGAAASEAEAGLSAAPAATQ
ncbi:MAG: hypothetical protein AAGM38_16105 [Pseudomonadota bacterium]